MRLRILVGNQENSVWLLWTILISYRPVDLFAVFAAGVSLDVDWAGQDRCGFEDRKNLRTASKNYKIWKKNQFFFNSIFFLANMPFIFSHKLCMICGNKGKSCALL